MQASLQRGDVPGYLRIGKSRKRGLGVRGSLPMVQHNRGVYDPGWTTSNFTRYFFYWTGFLTQKEDPYFYSTVKI